MHHKKILLVDSDYTFCDLTTECWQLEDGSFQSDFTTEFSRAVMAPAEQNFDLIILNTRMDLQQDDLKNYPKLQSQNAGSYLKDLYVAFYRAQNKPCPPIIYYMDYAAWELKDSELENVLAVITRPVDSDVLLQKMKSALSL